MTVAGSVDAFDHAAFASSFASAAGVPVDRLTVTVSSASVHVVVTIDVDTDADVEAITASLGALTAGDAAASSILGVDVLDIAPPSLEKAVTLASPPPAPLLPPRPPPDGESKSGSDVNATLVIILGACAGAGALVLCALVILRFRTSRVVPTHKMSSEDSSTDKSMYVRGKCDVPAVPSTKFAVNEA